MSTVQSLLPPLACDCHAHILGPASTYNYVPERVYTPEDALLTDYRQLLQRLGMARGVLVQPSVYGNDNSAMLDALREDPVRLRGVAVVGPDISSHELQHMHALGVRGLRCNIVDLKSGKGQLPLDLIRHLAETVQPLGWHIEFLMHVNEFPQLDELLGDLPVPMVFGHMGYVPVAQGNDTEGFHAMRRLARAGRAWVKMTAPYRLTPQLFPHTQVAPVARALIEDCPDRLLWGSDWPHVATKPPLPDDLDMLEQFIEWLADDSLIRTIFQENPQAVYQF